MQVLDSSQDLVEEHFDVVRGQVLRGHNDLVQVGLHELSDHVDLLKEVDVRGLQKIVRFYSMASTPVQTKFT